MFTYGTDDLKYGPSVVCAMLAALLLIVQGYRSRTLTLPGSVSFVLMLLFFGYLLLSTSWSSVGYASTYFVLIFLLIPLLFMAVVCTGRAEQLLPFALAGAGTVIGGVMIWALIQYVFMFGGDFGTRVKHPFLDPNNLAVFMNMGLLPVMALTFRAQIQRDQIIYGALTFLFFIALLATNSRMALMAAIIGFLVLLPVLIRQVRHPTLTVLGLFLAVASVILAMNYAMDGMLFFYMRDIFNFETSASMYDRLSLWMSSLNIFKDYFWLGTGLATFYYYYPQYRQPTDSSDGYFVHMDPLQIGLETGILGYVLIYAFLICILFRTIRVIRLPHLTGADRLLVLAPFTALLTVCIHMHMTFCLYLPAISIPVGVLLAWWYVVTQRYVTDPQVSLSSSKGRVASFISMALMAWGVIWALQANAGIYLNQKVALAAHENRIDDARSLLTWQYLLSPASSYRPYERDADLSLAKLKSMRGMSPELRRQALNQGMVVIDGAIARQPRHGSLRNLKAMMLYIAGDDARPGSTDEAITLLRYILRIDPMMLDSRLGLAMILRERGQFGAAVRLLEDGMLWPRPKGVPDVNYINTTAQFNLLVGNRARHDQLMAFAAERARIYGFTVVNTPN